MKFEKENEYGTKSVTYAFDLYASPTCAMCFTYVFHVVV